MQKTYVEAINETLHKLLETDENVFLMGQGVNSPWYVGNTCKGLLDNFGDKRIIDTPVSENCITGAGVGAAISGMKPIIVHPRLDFMFYAFDPICNHAANWNYMFNINCPITIWGIINRGGEQACQHSKAIQSMFCHVPGLKVVAPSNPYDAKGLLCSCVDDPNPTIVIYDRWLYDEVGEVPGELYKIPIGKGEVIKEGKDITIVSYSYMIKECKKAVEELEEIGISVELIDLRSLKPIDIDLICNSVMKTCMLLVVDGAWKMCGVSAEILASVNEIVGMCSDRLTLPDCPAPSCRVLEKEYYIKSEDVVKKVKEMVW